MAAFWMSNNCYLILGISPKASPQEIKSAYRTAARRVHPDYGGSPDAMTRANLAFEVLDNPVDRVAHDRQWRVVAKPDTGASQPVAPRTEQTPPRAKPPPRPATPPARPRAEAPFRSAEPQPKRPTPPQERSRVDPLSALRRRVQERVEAETKAAWADIQARSEHFTAEFKHRMWTARMGLFYRFIAVVGCSVAAIRIPLLWLGAAIAGFAFLSKVSGPSITGQNRSPFSFGSAWLSEAAKTEATNECSRRAAGFQRYRCRFSPPWDPVLKNFSRAFPP